MKEYTIGIFGLWHLGEVYAGCLADLGHTVIGWDSDATVVAHLKKGVMPLSEPQLEEKIKKGINDHRLSFTTDISIIKDCAVVWLTFDTPVDDYDKVILDPIWDFLTKAIKMCQQDVLFVISSQLPIGTTQAINDFIVQTRSELRFNVVYVPENLQLGRAVESFMKPKRIVIGTSKTEVSEKIKDIFEPLSAYFLCMSSASAEMSKHALNAFLATSLSFIYDIADLCQVYGADIVEVARALRSDDRIGREAYLDASLGFSGGTLARDLNILLERAQSAHVSLPVISAVFQKNRLRRTLVMNNLEHDLGSLQDKKIVIFGLTYKPGTSTLRRALSLEVIAELKKKGASIRAYDPSIRAGVSADLLTSIDIFDDPYLAAQGSHGAIFVTSWPEFKQFDLKKIRTHMPSPALFYDTRNYFYDKEQEIKKLGFKYRGIGR